MVKIDKHSFLNVISNFEIPENFDTNSIQEILANYPAFSSMQLLNAVLLNNTDKEIFSKNLTQIATKVKDRAILHDYVHQNIFSFKEEEEEVIEVQEIITSQNIEPEVTLKNISNSKIEKPLVVEPLKVATTLNKEVKKDLQINKIEVKKEESTKEVAPAKEVKTKVVSNQNKSIEQKPKNKSNRDNAYDNLSKELFGNKTEVVTSNTSEKERKRIEAMKKLQQELFQTKKTTKKAEKKTEEILEKNIPSSDIKLEKKTNDVIPTQFINKENVNIHINKENESTIIPTKTISEKERKGIEETKTIRTSTQKKLIEKEKEAASKTDRLEVLKQKIQKQRELKKLQVEKEKLENKPILNENKSEIIEKIITEKPIETFQEKLEKLKAKLKANREKLEKEQLQETKSIVKTKQTQLDIKKVPEQEVKNIPTAKKETSIIKEPLVKQENQSIITKQKIAIQKSLTKTKPSKVSAKIISKKTSITPQEHQETIKKSSDFLSWLKTTKSQKSIANKNNSSSVQTTAKKEEKIDIVPFERVSAIEVEIHEEIKHSSDPLDNFISGQISKKRKIKSREKKNISQGMVSETLAEIMLVQQNYSAAIEVYNTLSIKYPQKSIYFATQIEKIKTYL